MSVRYYPFVCLMLFLGACHQNNDTKHVPSDLLSKEQMIPLLVDIHLTEASLKLNQSIVLTKDVKLYYSSAYSPVFIKHKTSPEQFESSIQWYTRHIDQLDEIYAEVITRLSKLETQLKSKPIIPPGKKIKKTIAPATNIFQTTTPPGKKIFPQKPAKKIIPLEVPVKKKAKIITSSEKK
jgi:hypothetical protein